MAIVDARYQHVPARTEFVRIGCRSRNGELGYPAWGFTGQIAQHAARKIVEQRIKIGHRKGEDQALGRGDGAVKFETLDRLLACILQSKAGAGEGEALKALDRLVEQREVEAETFPLPLDANFINRGILRSGKARTASQIGKRQTGIKNRRRRCCECRSAWSGEEIAARRPAVPRQVHRARLETRSVAGIHVDFVGNPISRAQQVGELVIARLAVLDRVRNGQERRLELEGGQTEQRIGRRLRCSEQSRLVGRRKCLELGTRGDGATGRSNDERIDQVDLTQRIEALLSECKILLVVSIVEATRQDEAINRLKINRAENRIGAIVH